MLPPSPTNILNNALTTTVTITETPLETVTRGSPWTTARPYTYTGWDSPGRIDRPQVEIVTYRPQTNSFGQCSWQCKNHTAKIVGASIGGFVLGLLITLVIIVVLCRKIRAVQRALGHHSSSGYQGLGWIPKPQEWFLKSGGVKLDAEVADPLVRETNRASSVGSSA